VHVPGFSEGLGAGFAAAGVAYVLAFTLLMNYFAYLALKFYSGQQPRASVSRLGDNPLVVYGSLCRTMQPRVVSCRSPQARVCVYLVAPLQMVDCVRG
jgi:hypothetical protein